MSTPSEQRAHRFVDGCLQTEQKRTLVEAMLKRLATPELEPGEHCWGGGDYIFKHLVQQDV